MVAVAVEPYAASVGALGIAAILTLLLEEVVAHEDLMTVVNEAAAVLAHQVAA